MFLSPEEIHRLTGYTQRAAQLRWLRNHGIEPFVSAQGEISVTHDIIEEIQRRQCGLELRTKKNRPAPRLAAVQ